MGDLVYTIGPPSYVIRTWSTAFSAELITKEYTKEEIFASVATAKKCQDTVDFQDPIAIEEAWKLVHVITCDSAWGIGVGSYVDEYLKQHTRVFMRTMIENSQRFQYAHDNRTCSVANFMTINSRRMKDVGFIRLLRVYLLGFPETTESASTLVEYQRLEYPRMDPWTGHSPIIMATSTWKVKAKVLLTLLQAGACPDTRNVDGETALMLVCNTRSELENEKADMLLNYGANLDLFDSTFHNAFHSAISYNNKFTIMKLLAARKQRIQDSIDNGEDLWDNKDDEVRSESSSYSGYKSGFSICNSCESMSQSISESSSVSMEESMEESMEKDSTEMTDVDIAVQYEDRLSSKMVFQNSQAYTNPEYITRNRNKHLLYIDPLKMKTYRDESLLGFVSKSLLRWNVRNIERHMEIMQLLVDNGAPTEGIDFSTEDNTIRPSTHIGRDERFRRNGKIVQPHYGMARFCDRLDETGTLIFSVQKEDFNIRMHIEFEEIFRFIDLEMSQFPFNERPSYSDMEVIFHGMQFGKPFDYFPDNGCTGEDFKINFFVSEHQVVDNHHEYRKTELLTTNYDRTNNIFPEHNGVICFRFPKGPLPKWLFYDDMVELDGTRNIFYMSIVHLNRNFSFLQEAVTQKDRYHRTNMFKSAQQLCHALRRDENGNTALDLLETTLQKETRYQVRSVFGIAGLHRNDRGLLRRLRADHDKMTMAVCKTGLLNQNSILFTESEKKISEATNLRKSKKRSFSVFDKLPDDVCKTILSFV